LNTSSGNTGCIGISDAKPLPQQRHYPIGAELIQGGGTDFRVWAPKCKRVRLQISSTPGFSNKAFEVDLEAEEDGYFPNPGKRSRPGDVLQIQVGQWLLS